MSQEVSYRELKEQFVSHQNGTSVTEVAIVAANAPIVTFANIVACHVLFQTAYSHVWYVHYSQFCREKNAATVRCFEFCSLF